MKRILLLVMVTVVTFVGFSHAVEGELGVTLDVTWSSKYIWRGFDLMDDKAAWQPSIDLDLWGSGFSVNIWTAQPTSSGTSTTSTVNAEEWDYTITYANRFFGGERLQTDYAVSYIYYNFPDNAGKDVDAQEFNASFSWPSICPVDAIVPSYTVAKIWPSRGGGAARGLGGYFHIFGLSYDLATPDLVPGNPDQALSFMWDITYNDGAGLGDGSVDHDWSHMTWGVSTSIALGPGSFSPAVYYQTSMDDSVNTEDELWTSLSYTVKF